MKTKKALAGLFGLFGSFTAFSFFAGFLPAAAPFFFTESLVRRKRGRKPHKHTKQSISSLNRNGKQKIQLIHQTGIRSQI